MLNKSRHAGIRGSEVELSGISGDVQGEQVVNLRLQFDYVDTPGLNGLAVDLTYLEAALSMEIAGLIGTDLFSEYNIVIDYRAKTIRLTKEDQDVFGDQPFVSLPLLHESHLLVIELPYDGRSYRFGIDTGSRANYIAPSAMNFIPRWKVTTVRELEVVGADQAIVPSKLVEIYDFLTTKQPHRICGVRAS